MRAATSRAACLLVAVLATLSISSCSSQAPAPSPTPPPQNRAEWVLPLDEFVYNTGNLRDYAEALVEAPCYEAAGIDWKVPYRPSELGMGPSISRGMQQKFNVDLAKQYGYHRAPNLYEGVDNWKRFIEQNEVRVTLPGFEAAMKKCQGESRAKLPVPSDEALYYAPQAAATISDEASLDPSVTEAAAAWASCMTAEGYGGLSQPSDSPPDELSEKWQVGIPGTKAGPDEIAMATADAECGESSGWSEAYYQAVWNRQLKFVDENSDRLLRIRAELAADRERLLEAVSQNAPAAQ